MGTELTPAVKKAVVAVIDNILDELQGWGISYAIRRTT
jgi:Ni,Fe-hydrogenase maturation factor